MQVRNTRAPWRQLANRAGAVTTVTVLLHESHHVREPGDLVRMLWQGVMWGPALRPDGCIILIVCVCVVCVCVWIPGPLGYSLVTCSLQRAAATAVTHRCLDRE